MNTKLLALASLVAIVGAAPAAADTWARGDGRTCAEACRAQERVPHNSGTYGVTCRGWVDENAQREGVNADTYSRRQRCRVVFGDQPQDLRTYQCRCSDRRRND